MFAGHLHYWSLLYRVFASSLLVVVTPARSTSTLYMIVTSLMQACPATATTASNQRFQELAPQYTKNLHYAPLLGIGSGQRQLIAVTCIAEHA